MSYSIAKRYAKALFDLSQESKDDAAVSKDLEKIHQLIKTSDEFVQFIENPVIPLDKREVILQKVLKGKIVPLTNKFIFFLNFKNRLNLLGDVCKVFNELYLDRKGVLRVNITSSISLKNRQIDDISKHLKSRLKKDIETYVDDDPGLIGGLKIQEGDTVYDYSLRTQIEQFRKNLIKA